MNTETKSFKQWTFEDWLAIARYEGPVDPHIDFDRLQGGIRKIHDLMLDNKWRTLFEIESETGIPQASASAFLRHLRKIRFGSFIVEKRRRNPECGTWEYQVKERKFNG
jgi:hypothetical protein